MIMIVTTPSMIQKSTVPAVLVVGTKTPSLSLTLDSVILSIVRDSFPSIGHRSWLGAGPLAAQLQARFVPLFVWSFGFNL